VSHVSTSSTSRSRGARESASPSDFRSPAPTPRETTSASGRRSSTTYQTTLRETPVPTGRIYAERAAFFDHQTTLRETPVATGRIYAERAAFFDYQITLRETPVATGRIYAERTAFFDYQTTLRETYVETGRI